MFSRAIVRPPGENFAAGLTSATLGTPDYGMALRQHERYCLALEQCGLVLTRLPADLRFPDSTFVEDTAILAGERAILTRPGAPSRAGEVEDMAHVLPRFFVSITSIAAPGTLDGGDICDAGERFFIGISERTNEAGAEQLAVLLEQTGYSSVLVDVRGTPGILHLKSGISYIGDSRLLVIDALAGRSQWNGFEIVPVAPGEEYAANCIRVNDHLLVAAGFPATEARLRGLGYSLITVEMSEFQKMDGGLSCLSLRF